MIYHAHLIESFSNADAHTIHMVHFMVADTFWTNNAGVLNMLMLQIKFADMSQKAHFPNKAGSPTTLSIVKLTHPFVALQRKDPYQPRRCINQI